MWSVDSRELCQPRTEADGKPVTESNRVFAHARKEPPGRSLNVQSIRSLLRITGCSVASAAQAGAATIRPPQQPGWPGRRNPPAPATHQNRTRALVGHHVAQRFAGLVTYHAAVFADASRRARNAGSVPGRICAGR
jgi:hypothetical protein